jgi:NAD(P)-dependent dehydrogenase (short-subunit alcohol dehydrogenase family)
MTEGSLRPFGTWLQKGVALTELPDLDGKVVVVTGGTRGVGEALVERLAAAGATTVLTARDEARGAATGARVRAVTGNSSVHTVALDLTSLASELARRLEGSGVDAFSAHPGGVDTAMLRAMFDRPGLRRLHGPVARRTFLTPSDAAGGVLRVALDPELSARSGAYFELGVEKQAGPVARDRAAARRLWDVTMSLVDTAR